MKTLKEYNKEILESNPDKTGVACDLCGTEMYYQYPGIINCSYPGSKNVKCPECGHSDLMYLSK